MEYFEGKLDTDKWFPINLVDEVDGYTPEIGKLFSNVVVSYAFEGNTSTNAYSVTTNDFSEGDYGLYWLKIGQSEFTTNGKYVVIVQCTGCRTYKFSVEVRSFTKEEEYTGNNIVTLSLQSINIHNSYGDSLSITTDNIGGNAIKLQSYDSSCISMLSGKYGISIETTNTVADGAGIKVISDYRPALWLKSINGGYMEGIGILCEGDAHGAVFSGGGTSTSGMIISSTGWHGLEIISGTEGEANGINVLGRSDGPAFKVESIGIGSIGMSITGVTKGMVITGASDNGLEVIGNSSGSGFHCIGGSSGNGMTAISGTSGYGISAVGVTGDIDAAELGGGGGPDMSVEILAIKAKTDNLPADPASDTTVNTRLSTAGYTAPDNASITAIKAVTDVLTEADKLNALASSGITAKVHAVPINATTLLLKDMSNTSADMNNTNLIKNNVLKFKSGACQGQTIVITTQNASASQPYTFTVTPMINWNSIQVDDEVVIT